MFLPYLLNHTPSELLTEERIETLYRHIWGVRIRPVSEEKGWVHTPLTGKRDDNSKCQAHTVSHH